MTGSVATARRRGRPRLAPATHETTITLPTSLYDLCAREALARDVSVACVIREAIIASRRQRGELA